MNTHNYQLFYRLVPCVYFSTCTSLNCSYCCWTVLFLTTYTFNMHAQVSVRNKNRGRGVSGCWRATGDELQSLPLLPPSPPSSSLPLFCFGTSTYPPPPCLKLFSLRLKTEGKQEAFASCEGTDVFLRWAAKKKRKKKRPGLKGVLRAESVFSLLLPPLLFLPVSLSHCVFARLALSLTAVGSFFLLIIALLQLQQRQDKVENILWSRGWEVPFQTDSTRDQNRHVHGELTRGSPH